MSANLLTHWIFDGKLLIPPDTLTPRIEAADMCREWRARSGGRPPDPTKPKPPATSLYEGRYRALPNGFYTIVQKHPANHPFWNEKLSRYTLSGDMNGAADDDDKVYRGVETYQERPGDGSSAWFVPLICQKLDVPNIRGHVRGLGRLGIHPDGGSKGSEGCIAVMPISTKGSRERDLGLLFQLLTTCKETTLEVDIYASYHWWENEATEWKDNELPWRCLEHRDSDAGKVSFTRHTGNSAEYPSVLRKI